MATNIQMNILTDSDTYETLYPQTLGSLVSGKVSSANSADTATSATSATKLATSRTIITNLANTSTASFDGSSNITPGVSGTLGVSNGGTGVTSYSNLATQLSSYLGSTVYVKNGQYIGNGSTSTNAVNINFSSGDLFLIIIPWSCTIPDNPSSNYYPCNFSGFPFVFNLQTAGTRMQHYSVLPCTSKNTSGDVTTNDVMANYTYIQYTVSGTSFTIYNARFYGVNMTYTNSAISLTKSTYSSNFLNLSSCYYYYYILRS